MYIEDDPVSQRIFQQHLGDQFQVRLCDSIEDAKRDSVLGGASVIFCDYALPDGHATDLIKYLRSKQMDKPVIVLTKFTDNRVMHACWKEGAFDFIEKPLKRESLLHLIDIARTYPRPYSDRGIASHTLSSPDVKQAINFSALQSQYGLDLDLLGEIFALAESDFLQLRSALQTLVLCDDQESVYSALRYHLHRLESIAENIYAERVVHAVQSIQKAIDRRESIQPSDLLFLNETLVEAIAAMKEKLHREF